MAAALHSSFVMRPRPGVSLPACRLQHSQPPRPSLRCFSSSGQTTEVKTAAVTDQDVPAGCSRYSISIKKPLGIVLEQDKSTGNIVVVEVAEESSAAKTGLVKVGDQLVATSGITYDRESDYNGAMVKMGQKVVRLNVMGESFKTVAAAIKSHPGHMEVTLEFQRCE